MKRLGNLFKMPSLVGGARLRLSRWSPIAIGESRWTLWGGLLLAAAFPISVAWLQYQEHEERILHWSETALIETRMLAAHAEQTMTAVDVVLRSVTDFAQNAQASTPVELRHIMGTAEVHQMLRVRQSNVAQIGVLSIVALNGDMINFTRNYPPQSEQGAKINLSERDYFKAHLASPALEAYLSSPVQNKGTGTWTFYMTRKVRNRAGETIGLVLAGVESKYFEDFYKAIAQKKKSYTLFRADGINLARYPAIDNTLGKSWITSPIFQILRSGEQFRYVPPGTRTVLSFNESDGRVLAPVKLQKYPLVVSVRIPDPIIFENWRSNTILRMAIAIVVWLIASTFMMLWHWQAGYVARQATQSGMFRAAKHYLQHFNYEARTQFQRIFNASALMQAEHVQKADQADQQRAIAYSARQLLEHAESMVTIAQAEAGELALNLREVYLGELLATDVLPTANAWAETSENEFTYVFDEALIRPLHADAVQITQMILRALELSFDGVKRGRVSLRVKQIEKSANSVTVQVEVSDTGAGYEPAQLQYILDPVNMTMATNPVLFATGLAISRNRCLAQLMSGTAGVESAKGVGSRYWFSMELAKGARPSKEALKRAQQLSSAPDDDTLVMQDALLASHRGAHLLLVQEHVADVAPLRRVLEQLGLRTDATDSGQTALKMAKEAAFDLIISDTHMPDLSGIELARRIRLLPGGRLPPIIGLTASNLPSIHAGCLDAGMNEILVKPASVDTLSAAILKWLESGRPGRSI